MFSVLLAVIYLSFISLGLPDALLGASWPMMYPAFGVPVSAMGILSMTISVGTITSSLCSDWLTARLGPGKVTAISVAMTAAALLGFSASGSFWQLFLWAIPYGLGAGSVDACLNNYVALHYSSRHMSWLHCMWGLGASAGPVIMGAVLAGGGHWSEGYRVVGLLQAALSCGILLSLPLWKDRSGAAEAAASSKPLGQVLKIPGVPETLLAFFCYCALESTAGLWASSYLVLAKGVDPETSAAFAGMFYIGITAGRALNGFLTIKYSDSQLIRLGLGVLFLGILALLLPFGERVSLVGLILIGLGCAPIYPCIIHSTPAHFGPENSQALIGIQMACAYVGSLAMPPVFGFLAESVSAALLPFFLLAILALMAVMHRRVVRKAAA